MAIAIDAGSAVNEIKTTLDVSHQETESRAESARIGVPKAKTAATKPAPSASHFIWALSTPAALLKRSIREAAARRRLTLRAKTPAPDDNGDSHEGFSTANGFAIPPPPAMGPGRTAPPKEPTKTPAMQSQTAGRHRLERRRPFGKSRIEKTPTSATMSIHVHPETHAATSAKATSARRATRP